MLKNRIMNITNFKLSIINHDGGRYNILIAQQKSIKLEVYVNYN